MSGELDNLQDLSLSRTLPIANSSTLSKAAIEAALASQISKRVNLPADFGLRSEADGFAADKLTGQTLDHKYKISKLLGQGGMGAVYLAHHLALNKDVALKTFRGAKLTEDHWLRFKREAQSIAKLQHRNIVQVFDFGTADGVPYYTMEVLVGESLAERISRITSLELNEALFIFSELCHGLSACHTKAVVHRDIKPANVFLELIEGTDIITGVKLVDFGIAGLADSNLHEQRLTAVGTVFGSPLYMSPEQSMGIKVDARSDIYSSGCTLFEMLTGFPPFRASSALATMLCHQQLEAPPLSDNGDFPEWLETLISSMLAKAPDDRVQSLQEVLDIINYNWRAGDFQKPAQVGRTTARDHDKSQVNQLNSRSKSQSVSQSDTIPTLGAISGRQIFVAALAVMVASLIGFFVINIIVQKGHETDANTTANSNKSFELDAGHTSSTPQSQPTIELGSYRLPDRRDGLIHFRFPSQKIGLIGQGDESIRKAASGDVAIPAGPNVFFQAQQPVADNPKLLRGFGANDLRTLILDQGVYESCWRKSTTSEIVRFKSLQKLNAESSNFEKDTIADLNQLPLLDDLVIDGTSMTGVDLAQLKRLPELHCLVISGMKDCTPILEILARKSVLRYLTADGCGLTDDDMLKIGKMQNLDRFEAGGNEFTSKNLSALTRLKYLHKVKLTANNIGPEALPVMLKLPLHTTIYMPKKFWNAQTIPAMESRYGRENLDSRSNDDPEKHTKPEN